MIRRMSLLGMFVAICVALGLIAVPCRAASTTINNDQFWKDSSGNPLYSQGGGVFKFGSKWYWYGVHYAGAEAYYATPSSKKSDTRFVSVTCYSSTDLVNWVFEGNVLDSAATGLAGTGWLGRLGVAYNSTTKMYVLLAQHSGTSGNGELFATSSTPTGKFTFNNIQTTLPNVVNSTSGDQTVFIDDNGKAYLICSSASGREYLYVAPLRAADYLAVDSATQIFKSAGREGNCMFKYRGHYYFTSSDLHGWNASHTYVISATNIMGPYTTESVMGNTDMDFSHVSQTGFYVSVPGTVDTTIIFAGDRWSDFAGNGIGYNQWTPLSFLGTTPSMNSLSQWNLNATTGAWTVGQGNNWILNPSFEADRVVQTALAGWTDSTDQASFPGGNVASGHTGRFALVQSDSVAYRAKQSQQIANLPSGNYTLSGWVRSSGGQSACVLYAKTSSKEYDLTAASSIANWTQLTQTGIPVSDGKIEVGVRSIANAGNWVRVDDLSLIQAVSSSSTASSSSVANSSSKASSSSMVSSSSVTSSSSTATTAIRMLNLSLAQSYQVYDVLGHPVYAGTTLRQLPAGHWIVVARDQYGTRLGSWLLDQ